MVLTLALCFIECVREHPEHTRGLGTFDVKHSRNIHHAIMFNKLKVLEMGAIKIMSR